MTRSYVRYAVILAVAMLNAGCVMSQGRATSKYALNDYNSDAGIQRRVGAALTSHHDLDTTDVVVSAFYGTVDLTGRVNTYSDLVTTLAIVNRVDGVGNVRTQLCYGPRPGI